MSSKDNPFIRIAIFYDGTYFTRVCNYYLHEHERAARISLGGLHRFVRAKVAALENTKQKFCHIVDAHYFRGRLSAWQLRDNEMEGDRSLLYRERQFDDMLIREGVGLHYMPMPGTSSSDVCEQGVDVLLALEAMEMTRLKNFDLVVLVTGDGDFVPLVRKLQGLSARVMLLAWDVGSNGRQTRTSAALINEVNYPVMMHEVIQGGDPDNGPAIDDLFVRPYEPAVTPIRPAVAEQLLPDVEEEPIADDQWRHGVIAHISECRRYGFIREDGHITNEKNVFFHIKAADEVFIQTMRMNMRVSFIAQMGEHQGRMCEQALRVRIAQD